MSLLKAFLSPISNFAKEEKNNRVMEVESSSLDKGIPSKTCYERLLISQYINFLHFIWKEKDITTDFKTLKRRRRTKFFREIGTHLVIYS